ncbi:uncharacterized protein LOC124642454 [Helicoverpa zea]|uniref:uncharacterized protein LOC124642454 n=1 Tax=Helicoverpa zea TaxID=7113 RepID=UPI001F5602A0|nr:uncharacterized protein LOC124642454 [Helicoverpa zea]
MNFQTITDVVVLDKYSVKKYINMYQTLIDYAESIDMPVKLMIVVILVCSSARLILDLYEVIILFKHHDFLEVIILALAGHLHEPIFAVTLLSMVTDLIQDKLKNIKLKMIGQRNRTNDERLRFEIQQLLMLMDNRPLQFCIFPNLPMTLSLFLGFMSFATINIIAVLQIKSFYS